MSWYDDYKAAQRNKARTAPPLLSPIDVQLAFLPTAPLGFVSVSAGLSVNCAVRREGEGGYVWSIGAALLFWQLTVSFWRYAPTPKSQRA